MPVSFQSIVDNGSFTAANGSIGWRDLRNENSLVRWLAVKLTSRAYPQYNEIGEALSANVRGVEGCGFTDHKFRAQVQFPELERIAVGGPMTDAGLSAIRGLRKLRWLNISSTLPADVSNVPANRRKLARETAPPLKSRGVFDEGVRQLAGMASLEEVGFWGTRTIGTGFADLRGLTKLHTLRLSDEEITDDGAAAIAQLPGLRKLFLSKTKITDRGMRELAKIAGLEQLDVTGTAITDLGVRELINCEHLEHVALFHTKVTDISDGVPGADPGAPGSRRAIGNLPRRDRPA